MAGQTEQFTPIIVTPLAPDPIPVDGSDGKVHVVYELAVLNDSPRPMTITDIEIHGGAADGPLVGSYTGDEVAAHSLIAADYTLPVVPAKTVDVGRTVQLIIEAVFATGDEVPTNLVHRISATFGDVIPDQADYANQFPTSSTAIGAVVHVSDRRPVEVGPPLTGADWVAVNACCELSPHRGAMVPTGGRINGAERYAVDWVQFDFTQQPLVDFNTGQQADAHGDRGKLDSYIDFDQPVIAVADGTVVTVVNDLPEATPGVITPGLPLDDLGGNHVVVDIGGGAYAFFAHLKTGSVTANVGDHVTRGQELGRVGNSGNTTAPHLHFHVMDSPLPLTATNLPFQIDRFTLQGTVTPEKLEPSPTDGPRTNELPLILTAITFPPAS